MRDLVFAVRPEQQPGMRVLYSDISFLLLGFLLENLLGLSLDHAIERWVWHPMGITGASFRRVSQSPQLEIDPLVAATEQCPWRGAILQGQVHDDNCWAMGGFAGHAGAFARVQDVLQFARGLGLGFLSPQVLSAFWKRVTLPVGCERTLGWDTPSLGKSSAGTLFSQASVGHLGFTGTSLWIDPQAEVAVCLLTNRVHPSRDSLLIREFRPQFHDAVRLDLIG